jgi:hypothetical protein
LHFFLTNNIVLKQHNSRRGNAANRNTITYPYEKSGEKCGQFLEENSGGREAT